MKFKILYVLFILIVSTVPAHADKHFDGTELLNNSILNNTVSDENNYVRTGIAFLKYDGSDEIELFGGASLSNGQMVVSSAAFNGIHVNNSETWNQNIFVYSYMDFNNVASGYAQIMHVLVNRSTDEYITGALWYNATNEYYTYENSVLTARQGSRPPKNDYAYFGAGWNDTNLLILTKYINLSIIDNIEISQTVVNKTGCSILIQGRPTYTSYVNYTWIKNYNNVDNGDIITYYDAKSGNETYGFTTNITTELNYSVYYRQNGTSIFTQIGNEYNGNNSINITGTKYRNTDLKIILRSNETDSSNIISITFLTQISTTPTPSITSSSPSTPTTSFVNESKTFNAGSDQIGNWTWFIDSVLMKNSEINTANATYINSTAPNGTVYNVTAIITNTNGSAQTSWNWTPLQNYVTSNVTYCDGTNSTIVCIFNVSYYTPGTIQWGFNFSWTDTNQQYDWTYTNGIIIQSLTATSTNETLEFMKAPPLPTGIYYIQKSAAATSTLTIHANSWGMFNNWTSTMTFAGIAANESNDVCYTYYNVTNGLWESYYVGYSWNADYQLSKGASVMGYFDAQTDITSNIITPSSTELYSGWNMLGVQSSSNQIISGIKADIGANCSDSWYFNSSTGGYSNATSDSLQPNQGFLAYITQNMTWSRSTM